jgi:glycosyl transferase family 2
MKLVMTLLVRDEADIVGEQIAYHLNAGVDFVVVTDHRSTDGTTEILESYAREGRLELIREESPRIRQSDWVTRMARRAATEHQADWVINTDADEFWWPREGSLKQMLAAIPPELGVVRAVTRPFVPRPGEGWFAERLTVRLALAAPLNDPATPFRHVAKVAHRADPGVVVHQGNHDVSGAPLVRLRDWSPLELLHFPLRSREQIARKHETTWRAWQENLRGDLARARAVSDEGRPDAFYDRVVVDDEAVRRGLEEGSLVVDTRLCEVLRELRVHAGVGSPVEVTPTALADEVARAVDSVCLLEAQSVRLHRRLDELAGRVDRIERRRVLGYFSARS